MPTLLRDRFPAVENVKSIGKPKDIQTEGDRAPNVSILNGILDKISKNCLQPEPVLGNGNLRGSNLLDSIINANLMSLDWGWLLNTG